MLGLSRWFFCWYVITILPSKIYFYKFKAKKSILQKNFQGEIQIFSNILIFWNSLIWRKILLLWENWERSFKKNHSRKLGSSKSKNPHYGSLRHKSHSHCLEIEPSNKNILFFVLRAFHKLTNILDRMLINTQYKKYFLWVGGWWAEFLFFIEKKNWQWKFHWGGSRI